MNEIKNNLDKRICIPIERLNLPLRTNKALKRNGIEFVDQLISLEKEDIIVFRNIGEKSYQEIVDSLGKFTPSISDLNEEVGGEIFYTNSGDVSLGTRTSALNLPGIISSSLIKKGLVTLGQIENMSDEMLNRYFQFGKKEIRIIRDEISNFYMEHGYISKKDITNHEFSTESLGFSTRVQNSLLRYGITSIYQLLNMTPEEIRHIKNIGVNSIEEILSKIEEIKEKNDLDSDVKVDLIPDKPLVKKEPPDILVKKNISELKRIIRTRISHGQLHPEIFIDSKTVYEWLNSQLDTSIIHQEKVLELILETNTIGEEIISHFSSDSRSLSIFLKYYSEESPTLADLKDIYGVSRERIRQLLNRAEDKILDVFKHHPIPILKTSFKIAQEQGNDLIFTRWIETLQASGILQDEILKDNEYQTHIPGIDLLEAIIVWAHKKEDFESSETTESLYKSLGYRDASIKTIDNIGNVSKNITKKIKRTVIVQGGIKISEVCNLTGLANKYAVYLLHTIGIVHISNDWYSFAEVDKSSRQPIRNSALKLLEASGGQLEEKYLINGISSYLGRYSETPAPKDVIVHYLESLGFTLERGKYISNDTYNEERLSNTENIFLKCIKEIGPVISSNDVFPRLESEGLSNQSYYALRRNSPLPVSVGTCSGIMLHKLRGASITWEDVKNAAKRLDDIAAVQKIKLDINELQEVFRSSIKNSLLYNSSLNCRPIELDLKPPLPEKTRIYLYNLINPLNKQISGQYVINVNVPGYTQGDQANFNFSGDRIVFLMGYSPEYEVYVLWDAGLYRDFPNSRLVTVSSKVILKAVATGLAEYNRRLNNGIYESIIVSRRDRIDQGINLRMLRTQSRLIQD